MSVWKISAILALVGVVGLLATMVAHPNQTAVDALFYGGAICLTLAAVIFLADVVQVTKVLQTNQESRLYKSLFHPHDQICPPCHDSGLAVIAGQHFEGLFHIPRFQIFKAW